MLVGISGVFLIAALVMYAVWSELWQMRIAAALYGFAWGGSGGGMLQAIRAEYFGRKHLGKITGINQFVVAGFTLAGTIFAGHVHDATGEYTIALYVFVGAVALATFAIIGAERPRMPPEAGSAAQL
jgi:cyanate permease